MLVSNSFPFFIYSPSPALVQTQTQAQADVNYLCETQGKREKEIS